jgi:superfamily II DNA or RNA helicase
MVEIQIGNSYSKITGLTKQQEKTLRKTLSYTIGGSSAYFSGYGVRRKSLISKRGEFPTGLLPRVKEIIPDIRITDWPSAPEKQSSLKIKSDVKPYVAQTAAVEVAMRLSRGTISMPTGTGKSLVIALIAARLNVSTLVVVPTLEIKKQLTAGLLELLGRNHKVTVLNIDSQRLVKDSKHYDCLIIDEAHHAASKTYQRFNKTKWTGIYYRYFLTATPFRNDAEETLLFEAIAGQVIYKLDYKEAISKGYIVPVEAYYIDLPKQQTDAYLYQEVYKELVVNNTHRNDLIIDLVSSLVAADKSVLCLVKEVAHGKKLSGAYFVHGQSEDRKLIDDFNSGEIKKLVATTGIMGEGVDSKPCEYVIIAGLGKAKSQLMQQIGRGVRKYPGKTSAKVILFRDPSHKFLLRHFRAQAKILLDEYGVKVVRLDL